jgi:hypothetical protein
VLLWIWSFPLDEENPIELWPLVPDSPCITVLITSATSDHAAVLQDRCMEADIPYRGLIVSCSDNRVLDDKVLGIDRELHPNVPTEIPACHDAGGFVDPLGLHQNSERGVPAAYLYRRLFNGAHFPYVFRFSR